MEETDALGQFRQAKLHAHPGEQPDSQRLTDDETQDDPQAHRFDQQGERLAFQAHAGVRQGEQGQDGERDERHERMFEFLQGGGGVFRQLLHRKHDMVLPVRQQTPVGGQPGAPQLLQQVPGPVVQLPGIDDAARGNGERHQDSGESRVNSRLVERHPDGEPEKQVDDRVAHADGVGADGHTQQQATDEQASRRDGIRVENRDHDNGPDVVHDGKRREKDFQRNRYRKHRENAQGERDIRGHRNTPATGERPVAIEGDIHEGRYDHAADRGEDGQCRLAGIGQFAGQQFPLDLQTDHEKEDAHEAVGDPVADGFVQAERPDGKGEFRL